MKKELGCIIAHVLSSNVSLFFCVISVARKPFPKRELDSRSGSEEVVKEEQGPQKKRARVDKTQDSTGKVYFPPLQVYCITLSLSRMKRKRWRWEEREKSVGTPKVEPKKNRAERDR